MLGSPQPQTAAARRSWQYVSQKTPVLELSSAERGGRFARLARSGSWPGCRCLYMAMKFHGEPLKGGWWRQMRSGPKCIPKYGCVLFQGTLFEVG